MWFHMNRILKKQRISPVEKCDIFSKHLNSEHVTDFLHLSQNCKALAKSFLVPLLVLQLQLPA